MAEPSFNLGDGNWAGKSGNLLGYHKIDNNFYADELTFTRASTGTIVNAEGLIESVASGTPRVDYLNNSKGSLLLESQRTNLLTYSESFDNAYWTKGGASVTSGFTSPDGTTNAFKLIATSSVTASAHNIYSGAVSITSGNTYTQNLFFKYDNHQYIKLQYGATGTGGLTGNRNVVKLDILNKTIIQPDSPSVATITELSSDWVRVTLTATMAATGNISTEIVLSNSNWDNSSIKAGGESVYIYGAMLELGSYPTSYIPTSGTTVTRLADTSSTAGLSSVIGQTEGTMYIDFTYKGLEDVNNMTSLSDGGVSNRVQLNISSSGIGALIVSNGVTSFTSSNTSLVVGNRYKVAVKYKVNDFALWINGTETSTDTLGDVPLNLNRFSFAFTNGTAFHFNQTVSASLLYKTALTDTELATITTI